MSFVRSVVEIPKTAMPGHEPVPAYRERNGWSLEMYAAAKSLGLPEPVTLVERVDGVMLPVFYVRTEAAAEWARDFNRLFRREELSGQPVTFSRPAVSNRIPLVDVLIELRWTVGQHATAVRLFAFPRTHHAQMADETGVDVVACLRRHEVDQWLTQVRLLVPGFATS